MLLLCSWRRHWFHHLAVAGLFLQWHRDDRQKDQIYRKKLQNSNKTQTSFLLWSFVTVQYKIQHNYIAKATISTYWRNPSASDSIFYSHLKNRSKTVQICFNVDIRNQWVCGKWTWSNADSTSIIPFWELQKGGGTATGERATVTQCPAPLHLQFLPKG